MTLYLFDEIYLSIIQISTHKQSLKKIDKNALKERDNATLTDGQTAVMLGYFTS